MRLYGTLSSIAVPCFFMLSGAFTLADDRNENYAYFYSKCMKNVGIQTIIFSVLYFLYSEALIVLGIVVKGKEWSRLWIPIEDFVKGKPYYHMWYLYTLAGLYLLVPIILKIKNSVKEETFKKICIALFLVASISGRTSSFVLHWCITKVVCYLRYFTAGYQLRKWGEKKNNKVGSLFIILGVIGFIGIAVTDNIECGGHFCLGTIILSLFIFAGFSKVTMTINLDKLASKTLYIYLIHAFVWNLLSRVVRRIGVEVEAGIMIPIFVFLVFGVSYVLSVIYVKLWNSIDKKFLVSKKACKIFE